MNNKIKSCLDFQGFTPSKKTLRIMLKILDEKLNQLQNLKLQSKMNGMTIQRLC